MPQNPKNGRQFWIFKLVTWSTLFPSLDPHMCCFILNINHIHCTIFQCQCCIGCVWYVAVYLLFFFTRFQWGGYAWILTIRITLYCIAGWCRDINSQTRKLCKEIFGIHWRNFRVGLCILAQNCSLFVETLIYVYSTLKNIFLSFSRYNVWLPS